MTHMSDVQVTLVLAIAGSTKPLSHPVKTQAMEFVASLKEARKHTGRPEKFTVLSQLANGADQDLSALCHDDHGYAIDAVLPGPAFDYAMRNSDLLSFALKRDIDLKAFYRVSDTFPTGDTPEYAAQRKACYCQAALEIIERTDILLAVLDVQGVRPGATSQLPEGGTEHSILLALIYGIPVFLIDSTTGSQANEAILLKMSPGEFSDQMCQIPHLRKLHGVPLKELKAKPAKSIDCMLSVIRPGDQKPQDAFTGMISGRVATKASAAQYNGPGRRKRRSCLVASASGMWDFLVESPTKFLSSRKCIGTRLQDDASKSVTPSGEPVFPHSGWKGLGEVLPCNWLGWLMILLYLPALIFSLIEKGANSLVKKLARKPYQQAGAVHRGLLAAARCVGKWIDLTRLPTKAGSLSSAPIEDPDVAAIARRTERLRTRFRHQASHLHGLYRFAFVATATLNVLAMTCAFLATAVILREEGPRFDSQVLNEPHFWFRLQAGLLVLVFWLYMRNRRYSLQQHAVDARLVSERVRLLPILMLLGKERLLFRETLPQYARVSVAGTWVNQTLRDQITRTRRKTVRNGAGCWLQLASRVKTAEFRKSAIALVRNWLGGQVKWLDGVTGAYCCLALITETLQRIMSVGVLAVVIAVAFIRPTLWLDAIAMLGPAIGAFAIAVASQAEVVRLRERYYSLRESLAHHLDLLSDLMPTPPAPDGPDVLVACTTAAAETALLEAYEWRVIFKYHAMHSP